MRRVRIISKTVITIIFVGILALQSLVNGVHSYMQLRKEWKKPATFLCNLTDEVIKKTEQLEETENIRYISEYMETEQVLNFKEYQTNVMISAMKEGGIREELGFTDAVSLSKSMPYVILGRSVFQSMKNSRNESMPKDIGKQSVQEVFETENGKRVRAYIVEDDVIGEKVYMEIRHLKELMKEQEELEAKFVLSMTNSVDFEKKRKWLEVNGVILMPDMKEQEQLSVWEREKAEAGYHLSLGMISLLFTILLCGYEYRMKNYKSRIRLNDVETFHL